MRAVQCHLSLRKNEALLSGEDHMLESHPLSSILSKLLILRCHVHDHLPLALLGRRFPRCSIFAAHPEDHRGLPVVSLWRIKTPWSTCSKLLREGVLFRGYFSERAKGPL